MSRNLSVIIGDVNKIWTQDMKIAGLRRVKFVVGTLAYGFRILFMAQIRARDWG